MTLRALPRHVPRRTRAIWVATVTAVLALAAGAAPASATVILRDHYADDYAFSFDDCGFWVDVAGHAEGIAQIRVGKGDLTSAFFLHDNYEFAETWTRRDSGDSFRITGNGLFQETKAEPLGGTVFRFTSVNAGQPFLLWDAAGNLVLRDRGVIRQVLDFDTEGDDVPGGIFIQEVSFDVAGPHPGLDFNPCALLD